MNTQTLIIGGGLTGLALAYRLQQAGHGYLLVEARGRFGGRIKSLTVDGQNFDLGPSWIWQGQHRVAALLGHFNLPVFEQWSDGTQLYEQASGDVVQNAGFMSMAGSMRIGGGTSALTDALVQALDPARIFTNAAVRQIGTGPRAMLENGNIITAQQIVIAVPPRIAAQVTFEPSLPLAALSALAAIPTWMGAHAKCVAVFPTPFWRANGMSGDASSRRGPLAEIHDASPMDGDLGALFGFVGLPAEVRAQTGDALKDAALAQFVNLFGPQASAPIALHLEDWSQAPFTAAPADATPPPGHPAYRKPQALDAIWHGQLIFAVTEMAPDNGGLIEGALAAADTAAADILTR